MQLVLETIDGGFYRKIKNIIYPNFLFEHCFPITNFVFSSNFV